ncbi:unnamed protein product, partial [Rotaria sordida]
GDATPPKGPSSS